MFSKLQYISQGDTVEQQLYNIHQALDHGCDWIQLRFKNGNLHSDLVLAEAVKILCEKYQATFIINDKVYLTKEINADGVHLGLTDMKIQEARKILGNRKIIGGTANTLEDVLQRIKERCDYIGLGPFRFTTTKEELSPILGFDGYRTLIDQLSDQDLETPIYAIGGIRPDDIEALLNIGIYGIAVSGIITQAPQLITQLNEKLYVNF
ncbi:thiamine phosphate synthase [Flavobacterium sp. SM15]|uniref:thiamine phosphate synthase n=1 Tax=Flavobacterium sp. SM15 TaxID=2908005 RepID=UPI001EDB7D20|nr:thiamine phosphate synthase [Flavobacterium sp. SM15]MCG2610877.1 thiamine phosphate synthase [Flavobacterium sp. SM15]